MLNLALAFVLSISTATAARAATTIEGSHLENTEVGFNGFRLDVPRGFSAYNDVVAKDAKWLTYPELAKRYAAGLDQTAGVETQELLPFEGRKRGLAITLIRTIDPVPPLKQEKSYLRFLDFATSWGFRESKGVIIRDQRKIGDIHVGRMARTENSLLISTSFVLIPPRSVLCFTIIGPIAEKDDLLADVDAAIATLEIGPKKKL